MLYLRPWRDKHILPRVSVRRDLQYSRKSVILFSEETPTLQPSSPTKMPITFKGAGRMQFCERDTSHIFPLAAHLLVL